MSDQKTSRDPRGIHASRIMALIVRHSSEQKPLPTLSEMARAMNVRTDLFAAEIQALIVMGDISIRIDPQKPWRCAFRVGTTLLMTPGYDEGLPPALAPRRHAAALLLARLNELAELGQDAPSERDLGIELGITRSAVSYWLERLAQGGAIHIIPREAGLGLRDYQIVSSGKLVRSHHRRDDRAAGSNEARARKAPRADAGIMRQSTIAGGTDKPGAGAAAPPPAPEKRARQRRPCITCRNPFLSEGAGHRMCGTCRKRGEAMPVYRIAVN